jgi:hypothetical protein
LRTGKLSVSQFDAVARPLISSLDKSEHALWVKLGAKVCAEP